MSNIKNISAENCYSTIKENKDAYLVDVRTPYEWETFGRVDEESFDAQYIELTLINDCLLYTSPSPRDTLLSRMPSSA